MEKNFAIYSATFSATFILQYVSNIYLRAPSSTEIIIVSLKYRNYNLVEIFFLRIPQATKTLKVKRSILKFSLTIFLCMMFISSVSLDILFQDSNIYHTKILLHRDDYNASKQ